MTKPNPVNGLSAAQASKPEAIARVRAWRARGITCVVPANKLVVQPWSSLTDNDRRFIKENREMLKRVVRLELADDEAPEAPTPRPEVRVAVVPTALPEYFVGEHRITETEVRSALASLGDEAVHAYATGGTSRDEAYQMTKRRFEDLGAFLASHGRSR